MIQMQYLQNCIRQAATICDATTKMLYKLTTGGFAPKLHIFDNECSALLKAILSKHEIKFQLVPSHQKRHNAAERAIQTFKNHFITCLCLVDPDFPLSEWDHQSSGSSMRQSKTIAVLEGIYDINKTPLAPLGTKLLNHVKTFGTRGKEACAASFVTSNAKHWSIDSLDPLTPN
ncbi:hypothetical protein CTEN210_07001 [Chaetoceros tenuissimus]|uniref:Uncharacterized protein n=1 Tax=Chaetoceros tenuissimus TaxID=426638 RepID=A0AAD3H4X4_9STRA|nr:hypothetical protein CTEN210_07001 [Chaetoceros tenuissimus]